MRQTNHKGPATHAGLFHSLAGSFLAAEGFVLAKDPEIIGRYGGSSAFYRAKRGLSLSITFEPFDGNAAWMLFGREWSSEGRLLFLSSNYSKLAQRFGLDVPLSYSMGDGGQQDEIVEQIVADLKRTLPIVVSKVSLNDLLAVENEEPTGAAVNAARSFGANYSECVDISSFSES